MAAKVDIDLVGRRIVVKAGVTALDATVDLYSDLKEEWVSDAGGASKLTFPFRTTGGDPLPGGLKLGAYFFLRNDIGWRIRPHEADHEMVVFGNLYPESAALPTFVPSLGDFTCVIMLERSSLTQVVVSGSGVTAQDKQDIHDKVWTELEGSRQLQKSAALMRSGLVSGAVAPTATQFESADVAAPLSNLFRPRIVFWRTGALAGHAATVAAYQLVAGRGRFTVAAMPAAPAPGDEFLVV